MAFLSGGVRIISTQARPALDSVGNVISAADGCWMGKTQQWGGVFRVLQMLFVSIKALFLRYLKPFVLPDGVHSSGIDK